MVHHHRRMGSIWVWIVLVLNAVGLGAAAEERFCKDVLNREFNAVEGICGPCLKHYTSGADGFTSACRFTYPFVPQFSLDRETFEGIRVENASFADLDGDGFVDLIGQVDGKHIMYFKFDNETGAFLKDGQMLLEDHPRTRLSCIQNGFNGTNTIDCIAGMEGPGPLLKHVVLKRRGDVFEGTVMEYLFLPRFHEYLDKYSRFSVNIDQIQPLETGGFLLKYGDSRGSVGHWMFNRNQTSGEFMDAQLDVLPTVMHRLDRDNSANSFFTSMIDWNGDSYEDILVLDLVSGKVDLATLNRDGEFIKIVEEWNPFNNTFELLEGDVTKITSVVGVDVNFDGWTDLVVNMDSQLVVLLHRGDDILSRDLRFVGVQVTELAADDTQLWVPPLKERSVNAFVDLDGDGLLDIVGIRRTSANKNVSDLFFVWHNVGVDGIPRFNLMQNVDATSILTKFDQKKRVEFTISSFDVNDDGEMELFIAMSIELSTSIHCFHWNQNLTSFMDCEDGVSPFEGLAFGVDSRVSFWQYKDNGANAALVQDGDDKNGMVLPLSYLFFQDEPGNEFVPVPLNRTYLTSIFYANVTAKIQAELEANWFHLYNAENRVGFLRYAFADLDNDGQVEALVTGRDHPLRILQDARRNKNSKRIQFAMTDAPSSEFRDLAQTQPIPTIVDLDNDGDLHIMVDNFDQSTLLVNTGRDCVSRCLGRGTCAETLHSNLESQFQVKMAKEFQNLAHTGFAIGKCSCSPNFQGDQCQQCSARFYGIDCSQTCPQFSATELGKHDFEYPNASTVEQCKCLPSFTKYYLRRPEVAFSCECAPGFGFNNETKTCTACGPGFFKDRPGNQPCTKCGDPYETTSDIAATSPESCDCKPGFQRSDGQCTCSKGKYFSDVLQQCVKCDKNHFKDRVGFQACTKCPNARPFSFDTNHSSMNDTCQPEICPRGTSRNLVQRPDGTCLPCPKNTFGTDFGTCQECPTWIPTTETEGAESSEFCQAPIGSVRLDRAHDLETTVVKCDEGDLKGKLICDRPGLFLDVVNLTVGHWRSSKASLNIYRCEPATFCQGNGQELYCTANHTGIMCATCIDGYSVQNGQCLKCTESRLEQDKWVMVGSSIFIAIITAFPAIQVYSTSRERRSWLSRELKKHFQSLIQWLNETTLKFPSAGTKVRLLLGFFQVLVQFAFVNEVFKQTPNLVDAMINMDPGAWLQMTNIGCAMDVNFQVRVLIFTIAPLVSTLLVYLVLVNVRRKREEALYLRSLAKAAWLFVQIGLLIYPGISSLLFSVFLYRDFPLSNHNGQVARTFRKDLTMSYDEYLPLRIYAGVMILIYPIGICAFFYALIRNSKWHKKDDKHHWRAYATQTLTKPYRTDSPFAQLFETYELLRKLVLTAIYIVINQAVPQQFALQIYFGLCMVFWSILIQARPYRMWSDQTFAQSSLFLLAATSYLAMFTPENLGLILIIASILEVMACVGFFLFSAKEIDTASSNSPDDMNTTDMNEPPPLPGRQVEVAETTIKHNNVSLCIE